jgi:hypothetical protein
LDFQLFLNRGAGPRESPNMAVFETQPATIFRDLQNDISRQGL